ncbi:MAG: TetR/AcrR family transcriptional regulator [Myxococcales bacterium]|nr:MAG: TetR/AcrR family transcriptional regulator [Myxococcales bacterium]
MPAKRPSSRVVSKAEPKPRVGGRSARVVQEVLAAALELFAEQGYAGLSMDAVAARAGVNKTTVYRRWPTKAELVSAALYAMRDEEPAPPNTGSLEQDLVELLERMAVSLTTPRKRAFVSSFVVGNVDPELRALLRRLREERPAIPAIVFRRGLERGELPAGTDLQLIASALLGPIQSLVLLKRETVEKPFIERLVRLVLTGAVAGGARS